MSAAEAPFLITGLGLRCAVGQDAIRSCAAIRAGVSRFLEWPHLQGPLGDEEEAIVAASVTPDLGDCNWIAKLEALALQPLLESLWSAGLQELAEEGNSSRWALYLAAPPLDRPGLAEDEVSELVGDIEQNLLFPFETGPVSLVCRGHAGVLLALSQAMDDLAQGKREVCVVGGVDSVLHSAALFQLWQEDKLKTGANPGGYIPGEAGAFVVLETAQHCRSRGGRPLAGLTQVRTALELAPAFGELPGRADATAQVLRQSLADSPCGPGGIHRIINDLNGERWRFLEWAMADARALTGLPPDWRLWYPADCIGDVGAASGAVHLCMAARAFARSYAVGRGILVCNSSESGERAATGVYPPPLG